MSLPIPYQDFSKIQNWLSVGHWQSVEQYLSDKYPQHRAIIGQWCAESRKRKEAGDAFSIKERVA
jgi:hypothetical protein